MSPGQLMMPQLPPVVENVIVSQQQTIQESAKKEKPYIKRPRNSFWLFLDKNRDELIRKYGPKGKGGINKIAGQIWKELDESEKLKYNQMAEQERVQHLQMYPAWSSMENFGLYKERKHRKNPKEKKENTKLSTHCPSCDHHKPLSEPSLIRTLF